ncbi:MAG: prephenate dehydratase [Desulfobacteraceae bacterium]|nr:prephenate dehydratase [Desulfobacteraceae bacterium]MBU4055875.1 prephenate dehydratase [Pseudomonadota bacterium]
MEKQKKTNPGISEENENRFGEIRKQFDETDRQLVSCLNQRAKLSIEMGKIKAAVNDTVFKAAREKELLQTLVKKNPGPLPEDHLLAVYREILSSSRRLQQPREVAYLGPEGTFSYFAGVEYLGYSMEFRPKSNFNDVFHAVAAKEAELGIIPLENSLQGSVGQCLDLFLKYNLYIQSEVFSKISHTLLSNETTLSEVETIYSHHQPLEQCATWLRTHLPQAKIIPMESTAAAAKQIAGLKRCAAIGHIKLGEMLGLGVLARNIEDLPDNWTRFVIIGRSFPKGESHDKTSILFTLPDKSGALVGVLNLLAERKINMKKLESRPMRSEKWQYVFFTDVECDLSRPEYSDLVKELATSCHSLRILGSYPSGPYLDGL